MHHSPSWQKTCFFGLQILSGAGYKIICFLWNTLILDFDYQHCHNLYTHWVDSTEHHNILFTHWYTNQINLSFHKRFLSIPALPASDITLWRDINFKTYYSIQNSKQSNIIFSLINLSCKHQCWFEFYLIIYISIRSKRHQPSQPKIIIIITTPTINFFF